jgi:hypothetical protein
MFLSEQGCNVWQTHFSPDGRGLTFNGVKNNRSQVFVAPFRKGRVPRSEWILIADTGQDDKPHFSAEGKMIFFPSDRGGYRSIWTQALAPDMHRTGPPFAVYHAHDRRRSLRNPSTAFEIAVGPDMPFFDLQELKGNIWLLEPAKQDAH